MEKKQRAGAEREALKRQRSREARTVRAITPDESVDELFARLRSGAANVAGVTYQINLATLLLVSGRAEDSELPRISAVRPEGFEDIDCRLHDGRWLLVQSKQRGGSRLMGRAEIATVIAHAGQVEAARDYDGSVAGYAVVSNVGFAVGVTGWDSTIPGDDAELTKAVRDKLTVFGGDPASAEGLIARTRLVVIEDPFVEKVEALLTRTYSIPPAVAILVRSHLSADMAAASSAQRGRAVDAAHLRSLADLDAVVSRLLETVDLAGIDAALRDGVCEFADFSRDATDTEEEFFSGVQVVPSHIGADRDVVRVPECESVLRALKASRHVLIVGPSGTGKSALLWRATSMLQDGPMLIRVLRVETEADVQSLIRYVRVLAPSTDRKVLVCVDDLGRTSTELWPEARDRLFEMSGVSILGACRQEDLLPSIATGARLVDSWLARESAVRIYARLRRAGLELRAEPEEAIQRAEGLLMEFVAIVTTGHRLREVLRTQLQRLDDAEDAVSRDVLGVITALHTLGRSVSADDLPRLIGEPAAVISRRLARLRDEHLVMTDDGVSWRALHDLRAEVLLELLHEAPPPSLAATYARSIGAAPPDARPALYRRAATRVLRATRLEAVPSVGERLATAHRVIEPLVRSVGDRVGELATGTDTIAAAEVAALVDSAERLDVAAYAAATLGYIQQVTPPTVDVSSLYMLAYSSRFSAIFEGTDLLRPVVDIGAGLPEWDSSARRTALAQVPDEAIVRVLSEADLDVAVRFSERLEGYRTVPALTVARVYARHRADAADHLRVDVADVLAQLVSTLAILAELDGPAVEEAFGPIQHRATWAVEADEAGFSVDVAFSDRDEIPSSRSVLVRASTYSAETFCEVSAKAFARAADDTVRRGYQPQAGQDPTSLNAQAVFLSQRLFDACPEADVVSAEVVFPNLSSELNGTQTDGVKRMRAGVLPRRVTTERSVAVQVAVMELRSAERWTDRCRSQAVVSSDLVDLLTALPARLADHDSSRGRREWIERITSAASRTARLPGLPIDRQLVERLSAELPFAADFDQKLREAMHDPSQRALDLIAGCLLQVAKGLDDPSNLGGAGIRLAGAAQALAEGRADGTLPEYAGVGALLPIDLDELTSMAARALIARGRGVLPPEGVRGKSLSDIDLMTSAMATEAADRSRVALERRLMAYDIDVVAVAVGLIPDPPDPLLHLQLTVAVDAASWAATEEALLSWSAGARDSAGFSTRTTVVAKLAGRLVQIGVVLGSSSVRLRPIDPADYPDVATRLGLPLAASTYQDRSNGLIARLVAASSVNVRRRRRPSAWRDIGSMVALPDVSAVDGDPRPWRDALSIYAELKDSVAREGVDDESLAAALMGVDLSNADSFTSPIVQAVGRLQALSIEADLLSQP